MDQIDDPETGRGLIVYIVDFVNIRLGKNCCKYESFWTLCCLLVAHHCQNDDGVPPIVFKQISLITEGFKCRILPELPFSTA
jgi:hypothetical protein